MLKRQLKPAEHWVRWLFSCCWWFPLKPHQSGLVKDPFPHSPPLSRSSWSHPAVTPVIPPTLEAAAGGAWHHLFCPCHHFPEVRNAPGLEKARLLLAFTLQISGILLNYQIECKWDKSGWKVEKEGPNWLSDGVYKKWPASWNKETFVWTIFCLTIFNKQDTRKFN